MRNPVPKKSRGRSRFISVIGLIAISAGVWVGSETLRSRWLDVAISASPIVQPTEALFTPTFEYTLTPLSPTIIPTTDAPIFTPTATVNNPTPTANSELLIFAMSDGQFTHLFAFNPESQPLTRITNNPWDDQYPSVSPDGGKIAYSSRRNGYWDIYVLDLGANRLVRVTDTPQYDGAPTWSPDGKWLAYETYVDSNLEIVLQSFTDLSQPRIRLTNDPAADYAPAWSPLGRQIAFVSTTSGNEDIWIANLDQAENRFFNLTGNDAGPDIFPSWSPDGRSLAWTSQNAGTDNIFVQDLSVPNGLPRLIGSGQTPIWSPDGQTLAAFLKSPEEIYLTAYRVTDRQMVIPQVDLPGSVFGMAWKPDPFVSALAEHLLSESGPIPPVLWENQPPDTTSSELGRYNLVMLEDVTAAYPFMQDNAAEPFAALRVEIARQSGWDLLADLENAFLPITEPPTPGLVDEWLYTGRAFALPKAPIQAGWMVISRENYGSDIYWHLWIRTRYQDGSQGQPIRARIWNLDARYSGDKHAFEEGGEILPAPAGYWLDVTELASRYGWKPLPALSTWRTFYPAARFNQFVFSESLDWKAAMEQIYPPEAVNEPTGIPTQSLSSLMTPVPEEIVTDIPSPTEPGGPTIRPTWTPLPGSEQP